MISEKIAIATTTFYKPNSEVDINREQIARKTLRKASDKGYSVFVVDGGSTEEFLKEIEKYNNIKIFPELERGMGKSRRQVMKEAYNSEKTFVTWTEPEKESYIDNIEMVGEYMQATNLDLVVPTRTSLDSYPTTQQYAEKFGNSVWKELTGTNLDMWGGMRMFKRDLTNYFLNYEGKYGDLWDSIFIPVMDAIKDGKKVGSFNINYVHPLFQTEFEEGNVELSIKRLKQLENLIPALKTHWESYSSK